MSRLPSWVDNSTVTGLEIGSSGTEVSVGESLEFRLELCKCEILWGIGVRSGVGR